MKTPVVLFDHLSVGPDSRTFTIDNQVTIVALGMQPDDYITFEVIKLTAGEMAKVCGCYMSDPGMPQMAGVVQLECPACESDTLRPVRLTARNPVVILDSPQDVVLRAIYHGDGLDAHSVTAWAYDSETPDLTDTMRGCPPVCCEDEEETWIANGIHRCTNLGVELQEISNCGNLRWVICGAVIWIPTGNERCDDTGHYIEERNQCGQPRWTLKEPIIWVDTGQQRCSDTYVERQQVNQCGDLQWVETDELLWQYTGVERCGDTTVEQQQVNQCGDLRWVIGDDLVWTDTGARRCDGANYQREERNQCNTTRWATIEAIAWVETGSTRCRAGNYEAQEANQCGHLRWSVVEPEVWVATGARRCSPTNVELQETNQCGSLRWTVGEAIVWTDTGAQRCSLDVGLERLEKNQCGHTRWVTEGPLVWTPNGETKCQEGSLFQVETNQCGQMRLVDMEVECDPCCSSTALSTHTIASLTVDPTGGASGDTFCWLVTLNGVVAGADLMLTGVLSGTEQDANSYAAPTVIIPVGESSGEMCVDTLPGEPGEPDTQLCLALAVNDRIIAPPGPVCADVDYPEEGASTHTATLSVDPISADEGSTFTFTVTLDAPVAVADLTVQVALSGSEQDAHLYMTPRNVLIAIGASSGTFDVITINDAAGGPDLTLTGTINANGRLTSTGSPASATVLAVESGSEDPPSLPPGGFGGDCYIDTQSPSLSTFFINVATTGNLLYRTLSGSTLFDWMPPGGAPGDYEVMITASFAGPGASFSGPALGAWHVLNVNRNFQWQVSGAGNSALLSGTVHMRRVGEPGSEVTATIYETFLGASVDCP